MAKVTVNEDRCKGCELCVAACPKGIMKLDKAKLNTKGYHPALQRSRALHRLRILRADLPRLRNYG